MIRLCVLLILFVNLTEATQLRPWLGPDLLPILTANYTLQQYHWVRVSNHAVEDPSVDHFVSGGGSIAYSPYSLEIEVDTAATSANSYGWEDVRITGRYLLMNDITAEDPVSMTAGVSLSKVRPRFVRDISTFHHGSWEYLFHTAIGKEETCGATWASRAWGLVGLGVANEGSYWVESKIAYERNACDRYWYGLFLKGLFGFGSQDIDIDDFNGYGPIKHRSVDLGGRFSYSFHENGYLTAKYSFRVWSENFPAYTNVITIEYNYPFGL